MPSWQRITKPGTAFMKTFVLTLAATMFALAGASHALAADEPQLERLALCQDSWLDWKDDEPRMPRFARHFESRFDQSPEGASFTPKSPLRVLDHAVLEVYPQSAGMAVGFSLVIDADFAQARAAIAKQLGKQMTCALSEGVRSCELAVGA